MNELKTVNCEQLMTTPLKPIEFCIDFVNITLHDYLKKSSFFGAPPIFTERSGVNIGGAPAA